MIFVHGGISVKVAKEYGSIKTLEEKGKNLDFSKQSEIFGDAGPLWYRGHSTGTEDCYNLEFILDKLNAGYMVMGHTIKSQITARCDNKALLIDTGISRHLNNRLSAIEIF
mmetsp:Transcript_22108/g.3667  ORF Transcript_22108/g.3667 Transcript_22108/m.3667 type:complete len:111 (+) Transcript_22108:489-821(+)